MKFACKNCRFKFQKSDYPKCCPYCGKEDSVYADADPEFSNVNDMLG